MQDLETKELVQSSINSQYPSKANGGFAIQGENAQLQKSATTEGVISRQAQEVQAAMAIAKRFPRDEGSAYHRIMQACRRKTLAEGAVYEYPRGGTKVEGPSIRLAETLAQNWGNIDFGIIELEQRNGESQVMAYAWDLETNTRQTKIFSVPHVRYTARAGNTRLNDPRDVYEMVANQGARRLRACILGVIPGDITEAALEECKKTLTSENKEPLPDRIRKMLDSFHTKHGVTKEMIEKYIGFQTTAFTEQSLLRLGQIWNSLKDGMTKREDYFDIPQVASDPKKSVKTAKTADEMSELEKSEEESVIIPQTNGKGK